MGNFVSVDQLNLPCFSSNMLHVYDMQTMVPYAAVLWPYVSCAGWSEIQKRQEGSVSTPWGMAGEAGAMAWLLYLAFLLSCGACQCLL